MHTSIFIVALLFICIKAQGPYGAPNLGGGYGSQLPQGPPPMMMQGGYGNPMEEYGNQQLGAYGNHPVPHGYGPKPLPPPPPPPQPQSYGNPEMPPFMPPPQPQQGYGQNAGFKMQQGFGDNGLQQEGFGFEGFKESNDESVSSTLKSSDTTAASTKSSSHH